MTHDVIVLGVFVADTTYRAARQPVMGETILGDGFALGPGGKGSNQAVAAAKAGANVGFLSKLGKDTFADMALATWAAAGVTPLVTHHPESYTGAACIFVDSATGNNAIIIAPGVAATIGQADIDAHVADISRAKVFMTQLEQPMEAAAHALHLARAGGAITILNPAPAADVSNAMLSLCDYVTPNETEAETLTGISVETPQDAARAAEALMARGSRAVIVTLGGQGCLFHDGSEPMHVPAMSAGPLVETTGAGDAFNGGFAAALARGRDPMDAIRFGTATAALSVTRPGAAASMPDRDEITALLSSRSDI
ncbi:ribokinase [Gymnodinialimonas sp. 2305UL16-5]|uniref:ribokinase n=1 Tax=Gymnodinialimonas mytili TaxID=3126503 RepID=UPI0030A0DE63